MSITTPDSIAYPNTGYTSGFVNAMSTMATSIQSAFSKRQKYNYVWANASARAAQTGMVAGSDGWQTDVGLPYVYTGTVWKPNVPGLWPIVPTLASGSGWAVSTGGRITATAATATGVFSGVFTAGFDTYKLILKGAHAAGTLNMQLANAGTADSTASAYDLDRIGQVGNSATALADQILGQTAWTIGSNVSTPTSHRIELDVFDPATAVPTTAMGLMFSFTNPGTATNNNLIVAKGFVHRSSAAFDGFAIIPPAAFTGTISCYGFNNNT